MKSRKQGIRLLETYDDLKGTASKALLLSKENCKDKTEYKYVHIQCLTHSPLDINDM